MSNVRWVAASAETVALEGPLFAVQATSLSDPREVRSLAVQAEDLGYVELYSYGHVGAEDPFVPLVAAAAATSRLRVGTLVLNNEPHHPALLARTVASVDRLTDGRAVLGIGTGYEQAEHQAIGVPLRDPVRRVARLEESIVALRALLDTGAVCLEGDHHHLDIADLGIRPLQDHLPLLVGGHGRGVIGVAGRHADTFQFTGLTTNPTAPPVPVVSPWRRWWSGRAG